MLFGRLCDNDWLDAIGICEFANGLTHARVPGRSHLHIIHIGQTTKTKSATNSKMCKLPGSGWGAITKHVVLRERGERGERANYAGPASIVVV